MQYIEGTITVTNSSAVVTGANTSWSAEIAVGDLFQVRDVPVLFIIQSVDSDTQVTLSANWTAATESGLEYQIVRDFTANLELPLPNSGDYDTLSVISNAISQMDVLMANTPVVFTVDIVDGADTFAFDANAPFAFEVVDAWSVNQSADGGTWKITDGTNDITPALTVAASDTDIDRAVKVDDAYSSIAKNGTLKVVATGSLDSKVCISCVRA